MKKKSIIALSAALIAALAIGSSLALQTSSTNGVNVMTFGEVEIAQREYERATDENGKWIPAPEYNVTFGKDTYTPDKLQPFTQNKPIAPSFYVNGKVKWDDRNGSEKSSGEGSHQQSWKEVGAPGSNQLFDSSVKNVIDKFVFVENTGNNPVFYRTIVAIELPEGLGDSVVHTSFNPNNRFDYNVDVEGNQNSKESNKFLVTIDGVRYLVYTATYTEVLAPGEVSRPSLLQVYLDPTATNEDVALFDGSLDILVFSQATQVFDDEVTANMALEAAFGKVETNLPWTDATFTKPLISNNTLEVNQNLILRDEPLYSNTTATEAVTINGNGNTITQVATNVDAFSWSNNGTIPATSNIFSSSNGSKVTVNKLNFAGTMQSIMLGNYVSASYNNFDTELNEVNVIGAEVVSFSNGVSPAVTVYGKATIKNSNIYGTKLSALDTDPMWPVYDLALTNYTTTNINNSKIGSIYTWNHALLNINEGSSVDTILTASTPTKEGGVVINSGANVNLIDVNEKDTYAYKVAITIKAGAKVETLDLTGADSRATIIVEDGATVTNIINPNGAIIKNA